MLDDLGEHVRRERQVARKLRRTRWWHNLRDNSNCHYCSEPLTKSRATMDHVVALRLGGRSTKDNIVPCCLPCNRKKRDDYMVDWFRKTF